MEEEENDKREFSELTKEERRARVRKYFFGTSKDEYMGNIWGWKFSIISLGIILFFSALALYGIYTGKIDLKKVQEQEQRIF